MKVVTLRETRIVKDGTLKVVPVGTELDLDEGDVQKLNKKSRRPVYEAVSASSAPAPVTPDGNSGDPTVSHPPAAKAKPATTKPPGGRKTKAKPATKATPSAQDAGSGPPKE